MLCAHIGGGSRLEIFSGECLLGEVGRSPTLNLNTDIYIIYYVYIY